MWWRQHFPPLTYRVGGIHCPHIIEFPSRIRHPDTAAESGKIAVKRHKTDSSAAIPPLEHVAKVLRHYISLDIRITEHCDPHHLRAAVCKSRLKPGKNLSGWQIALYKDNIAIQRGLDKSFGRNNGIRIGIGHGRLRIFGVDIFRNDTVSGPSA